MSSVGVVFGGLSPEHDISILTGLQAARLLTGAGHDAVCIYWTRGGTWQQVPSSLEGDDFSQPEIKGASPLSFRLPEGFVERKRMKDVRLDLDAVVNCCHGGPGEDGTLTALLAMAGLRVTGPAPEAAAWSMDKLSTAGMVRLARLERFGIEELPTLPITSDMDVDPAIFPTPWVVKPRFGGSSIGVEVGVEDLDTARALATTGVARGGAVLQPQRVGWSDINVAVRTYPDLQCSAIERPLTGGEVYGYAEKYLAGAGGMEAAKRELPANLPEGVTKRIQQASLALAEAVGLTGTPRIDFLYDGEERLAFCEVNTIPGSLALYLWAAAGVDRTRLVLDLVDEALRAPALPAHWSAATDGAALRAANTVASKLR